MFFFRELHQDYCLQAAGVPNQIARYGDFFFKSTSLSHAPAANIFAAVGIERLHC